MFKENDKVVCIDDFCYSSSDGKWNIPFQLLKYNIYTISTIRVSSISNEYIVNLIGMEGIVFKANRFISLTEHRKQKINKLINYDNK